MHRKLLLIVLLMLAAAGLCAAETERGVVVNEAVVHISPDPQSARLANLTRGRDMAILETSGKWLHVMASVRSAKDMNADNMLDSEKDVTGWIEAKGVVRQSTANGDQILFGEAVNSEMEASRRRGRRGADQDAFQLYRMVAEYFPNSPLAGEAAYRTADIKWQLERADMLRRPSAKAPDPYMRHQMDEELMRRVMKKYPGTKWADLASFHLIENKLCGDWQGQSKCPVKEAELYEKYVTEHPDSPAAAEALYNAATRRAALVDIYKNEQQAGKSNEARNSALALIQRLTAKYTQGDWVPRARTLQFQLEQGLPTYGITTESVGGPNT
jgi:hypothetical protein